MYLKKNWHDVAMLVKLWFVSLIMMKCVVSSLETFKGTHNNTGCHAGHFKCYDGECILSTEKCDGWHDCDDGSDELNCELESCEPPHFYKCANGACIDVKMVCNEEIDCPDGSDEVGCPYSTDLASRSAACHDYEFTCLDHLCIPKDWVCDGSNDCVDGSDEHPSYCLKNHHCTEKEMQCRNKVCIPKEWHCDGTRDCVDGSDEDEDCPSRVFPIENCTLENRMFACKDKVLCIELYQVCNKHPDCLDGSDEGGQCSNVAQCHDKKCSTHECIHSPEGPLCVCAAGFKLEKSNCTDINECEEYGICGQKCENVLGTYRCHCDKGYSLQRDSHTCKTEDPADAVMFISLMTEIRGYFLGKEFYYIVANDLSQVVGVEYDGRHLFWSNIFEGQEAIVRADETGENMKRIVTAGLGEPEDLAVDWVTRNIYFTDSKNQFIGVCSSTGSKCTVMHNSDIDKPRGIALLPKEGYMYWSDWGKRPVIARSGMDGSELTDFVSKDLSWPNGITIDHGNERLYWVDAKLSTIESIKLDGTDRRRVLENTVEHPYSIAVFEDTLYWSDWESMKIEAANKFTGKNRRTIMHAKKRVYGISIFHPAMQDEEIYNHCQDAPCSDLCLLSPMNATGRRYACACPEGKKLSTNGHLCIAADKKQVLLIASNQKLYQLEHKHLGHQFVEEIPVENEAFGQIGAIEYDSITGNVIVSDISRKKLVSVNLETQDSSDLVVTHLGRVQGLSFDFLGNNLYWTDSELGKLEVVNLHNHQRMTILQRLEGDVPTDVAVIPEEGVMFVSLFSPRGSHIDMLPMSGGDVSHRKHLFEEHLTGPHLPLFYDRDLHRIFWADSGTYLIEHTSADGLERHTFRQLLMAPLSITSVGNDMFWTCQDTGLLNYANKFLGASGNKQIELDHSVRSENLLLAGITGIDSGYSHPCHANNGNCSHLCLISTKESKKCACPDGMFLQDGHTCLFSVACKRSEFECELSPVQGAGHLCIPSSQKCDSHKDCPNGEDEDRSLCGAELLKCRTGQYACADGKKCIDQHQKCDLVYDCEDHSDENVCMAELECEAQGKFKCGSSECIDMGRRCDYHKDCRDDSDEDGCETATCDPESQFRCSSGNCIPKTWECDNELDCHDGSDEHFSCNYTRSCTIDQLTCGNGQCVDKVLKCDGAVDCDDETDELGCPPVVIMPRPFNSPRPQPCDYHTQYACSLPVGRCLPKSARCNGTSECDGGEDELHCAECYDNQFQCRNGKCIPMEWVCDKKDDCNDNSDEEQIICQNNSTELGANNLPCFGFHCANGIECVHMEKVCDGTANCHDGSDEGGKCGKGCLNAGCSDVCHETPSGPKCSCHKGYQLMGDAKTCSDIDECTTGEYCSQYCTNIPGGFQCSCHYPEYALREDRMSCKAKGSEMQYVFALYNDVRTMWGSHSHIGIVYSDENFEFRLSGLGVDFKRRYVFWTSDAKGSMNRVSLDDRRRIQNVTVNKPGKLAVDWVTGNVYVVERGFQITACNFDTKACAWIYSSEPAMYIEALAVDPISRTMFWSERLTNKLSFSSIYRAELSGGNHVKLISSDLTQVSDIFIDTFHSMIYWADTKSKKIERASFNGTHREEVFVSGDTPIDITIFEDNAYFLVKADSVFSQNDMEEHGNVWRCGLYGSSLNQCHQTRIHPKRFTTPYHFDILHQAMQLKGSNECGGKMTDECSRGGGLCILAKFGRTPTSVCVCPDGTRLRKNSECRRSSFKTSFADGTTYHVFNEGDSHDKFNKYRLNDEKSESSGGDWWILLGLLFVAVPLVGLMYLFAGSGYRPSVSVPMPSCQWIPKLCRRKFSFHTIHFNPAYSRPNAAGTGLNDHTAAYSDFQFHHAHLSPGEHQYENPIATLHDKSVTIKSVNEIDIKVGPEKSRNRWTGASEPTAQRMKAVDDSDSDTSSTIEMASVAVGENHNEPLLQ